MYYRIRNLRDDKDLSQKDMARVLSISQTTYSRYESGVLDIPTEALINLAKYHNTSIDYLLNLTNQKAPYPRASYK